MVDDIKKKAVEILCILGGVYVVLILVYAILIFANAHEPDDADFCISSSDIGRNVVYDLNVGKIKCSGDVPDSDANLLTTRGQAMTWVRTNLITNGAPLVVFAEREWFPSGSASTPKTKQKIENGKEVYVTQECSFSNEIQKTESLGERCDEILYYPNDTFRSNVYSRYNTASGFRNDIQSQIDYVDNMHYQSKTGYSTSNPGGLKLADSSQIFNKYVNYSCAMKNGYGVYLRFDTDPMAYHVANKYIDIKESDKVVDAFNNLVENQYRYMVDTNGCRMQKLIPLTLPLEDEAEKMLQCSDDPTMKDYCYDSKLLESGRRINLTVANTHCLHDGIVKLIFRSGAEYDNASKISFFNLIRDSLIKPMFGSDVLSGQWSNTSYVTSVRNDILSNSIFQALRFMVVIFSIILLGYKVMMGGFALDPKNGKKLPPTPEIIKMILFISIGLWATDPSNYTFVDNVIIPFIYKGIMSISDIFILAIQKTVSYGIGNKGSYGVLEETMMSFFSDAVFNKTLAIFGDRFHIFLMIPIFWICIIIVFMEFIKSIIIICLTMMTFGVLIILSPIVSIFLFLEFMRDKFWGWIDSMKDLMIKQAAVLFSLVLAIEFVTSILAKLLAFEICKNKFMDFFGGWYRWKIVGNFDDTQFTVNIIIFGIITYLIKDIRDLISGAIGSIFGKFEFEKGFGKNMFGNLIDSVTFQGAVKPLSDAIMPKKLSKLLSTARGTMMDPSKNVVDNIKDIAKPIGGFVGRRIAGAAGEVVNLGKHVVQGNGGEYFKNIPGRVAGSVKELGRDIKDAVVTKDNFGIAHGVVSSLFNNKNIKMNNKPVIDAKLTSLTSKKSSLSSRLNNLTTQKESMSLKLSDLMTKRKLLMEKIKSLDGKKDPESIALRKQLMGELSSLDSSISEARSDLSSIDSSISEARSDLSSIDSSISQNSEEDIKNNESLDGLLKADMNLGDEVAKFDEEISMGQNLEIAPGMSDDEKQKKLEKKKELAMKEKEKIEAKLAYSPFQDDAEYKEYMKGSENLYEEVDEKLKSYKSASDSEAKELLQNEMKEMIEKFNKEYKTDGKMSEIKMKDMKSFTSDFDTQNMLLSSGWQRSKMKLFAAEESIKKTDQELKKNK